MLSTITGPDAQIVRDLNDLSPLPDEEMDRHRTASNQRYIRNELTRATDPGREEYLRMQERIHENAHLLQEHAPVYNRQVDELTARYTPVRDQEEAYGAVADVFGDVETFLDERRTLLHAVRDQWQIAVEMLHSDNPEIRDIPRGNRPMQWGLDLVARAERRLYDRKLQRLDAVEAEYEAWREDATVEA